MIAIPTSDATITPARPWASLSPNNPPIDSRKYTTMSANAPNVEHHTNSEK